VKFYKALRENAVIACLGKVTVTSSIKVKVKLSL
jgi:hypothetical protein